MNSCLYECRVMHHRLTPKEHRFTYGIFMFCLDLDELDLLEKNLRWFSRNRWNFYSFWDKDHLGAVGPDTLKNLKDYAYAQGCTEPVDRVLLVTLPRVLGYVFNPVSFYFCFSKQGLPLCAVAEVRNTFGELKLFFLSGNEEVTKVGFESQQTKYFYVSPFFDHDLQFMFKLQMPGEKIVMQVDDLKNSEVVLHTTLTGKRCELTNFDLLRMTWRYPLVTLKVIGGIHWEAFLLWKKGLPFHRKAAYPELQRDMHHPYQVSASTPITREK